MPGNNSQDKFDSKPDSLYPELQEIAQESKELRGKVQYFEYKNKSKDGNYYIFSYNTIISDGIDNIKRKYTNRYGGNMDNLFVTDIKGNEINDSEFIGGGKVYLKVKISDFPSPIEFKDVDESGEDIKVCTIKNPGWNTASIKQFYQDKFGEKTENDGFFIKDEKGNIYNDNYKFNEGDTVFVTIKKKSIVTQTNTHGEDKGEQKNEKLNNEEGNIEKLNTENPFLEMIEKQKGPVLHGNRKKPEISITIDDGNGAGNIKHILDILRGSGIRATFFILGTSIKDNPSLWNQAIEEGNQVCCHTYSHIYLNDKSDITQLRNTLSEREILNWMSNVKGLLGNEYFNKLKAQVGKDFPYIIPSSLLLKTEILMREAQIKKTLGEPYLKKLKSEFPFFRFPGGSGWFRENNIKVLKELGYLSIGWSDDFYRGAGKSRKHISINNVGNLNILNGDIPLFHFKESDFGYIDTYIKNMKG